MDTKFVRILSILFITLSLIFCNKVGAEPEAEEIDEEYEKLWKSVHYQIYDNKGLHKDPHEILDLFKQLQAIYVGHDDRATRHRRSKVNVLVEVATIRTDKCRRKNFDQFSQLIERNSPFFNNVVPYLKHYRREQIRICQSEFKRNFDKAFAEMGTDTEVKILRLVAKVVEASEDRIRLEERQDMFHTPHTFMTRGIFTYMLDEGAEEEMKQLALLKKKDGLDEVWNLLNTHILPITGATKHAMDQFMFILTQGLGPQIDDNLRLWIQIDNLCHDIWDDVYKIRDDIYLIVMDTYGPPKQNFGKKLMKRIRNKVGKDV